MSVTALSPDLILTNATVLTADADNSQAEAVAVYNGHIGHLYRCTRLRDQLCSVARRDPDCRHYHATRACSRRSH